MEEKTIYNLRMHESIWIAKINKDVLRVDGGWIYSNYCHETDTILGGVFVPFNSEFQKK